MRKSSAPDSFSTAVMRRDFILHLFGGTVEFAQEQRGRVEVVARVHGFLHGARRRLVHQLEPGRDDARGDDGGGGIAGLSTSSKAARITRAVCGLGTSFTVISMVTASMPSEPIDQREQVIARRIERLAAGFEHLALDGAGAHTQDVVQRKAILEAMHAAAIFGHIAAYAAGDLRRGIRRVIQAVGRRRFGDRPGYARPGCHGRAIRASGSSVQDGF